MLHVERLEVMKCATPWKNEIKKTRNFTSHSSISCWTHGPDFDPRPRAALRPAPSEVVRKIEVPPSSAAGGQWPPVTTGLPGEIGGASKVALGEQSQCRQLQMVGKDHVGDFIIWNKYKLWPSSKTLLDMILASFAGIQEEGRVCAALRSWCACGTWLHARA